jgi:hypothetical protein
LTSANSCSALVEHDDGRLEIVRWTGRAEAPALDRDARRRIPDAAGLVP